MRSISFTVLALLFCGSALAQADADAPIPEPDPVYDIEVIVFEYVGGVKGAREDWRYIDTGRDTVDRQLQEAMPDDADAAEPELPDDNIDGDAPVEIKQLTFEPLRDEQMRLKDTVSRLRGSRDYRPLVHTGWRQPVYGNSNETTLDLARVARMPATLKGSASLFVTRFLHLTLLLEKADNRAGNDGGTDSVVFTLNERRKMRSSELHFFDHPRFGALALISRTDSAASEPSDSPAPGQ